MTCPRSQSQLSVRDGIWIQVCLLLHLHCFHTWCFCFLFLAVLRGFQDLGSPTREWTWALGTGPPGNSPYLVFKCLWFKFQTPTPLLSFAMNMKTSHHSIVLHKKLWDNCVATEIKNTVLPKKMKYLGVNLTKYERDAMLKITSVDERNKRWPKIIGETYHVHGLEESIS